MLSRRNILSGVASAAMLAACGQSAGTHKDIVSNTMAGKRKIDKVGIQSYTFREALAKDFKGTFQMVKDVGYDYVELNERNYEDRTAEELKAVLDEVGLPSPASHISYDNLENDVPSLIKTAKTLEAKYLILPYMHSHVRTLEDWKYHASLFNKAGERMAGEGVRFAYHNHQFEWDDIGGGTTAMDVLMAETNPEFVDFELDLFWATLASVDIEAFIRANPGRFKLCHIKDMIGDPKQAKNLEYEEIGNSIMVNVGEGQIDFESIFALNDISGLEYFVAEHDHPKPPYRDAIATSHDAIRNMRF